MKHWPAFAVSMVLLALATGCPFTSKVPVGEPGRRSFDARLIGSWTGVDHDRDTVRIAVFPFNDAEYYVELTEGGGAPSRYRAFVFDAGGQPFLQINEISTDPAPEEYSFARYTLSGDRELSLRFVGEKIVPKALATEPKALAAFLGTHRNDPALDDDDSNLLLKRDDPEAGNRHLQPGSGGGAKP
jgi:hypothetical protein